MPTPAQLVAGGAAINFGTGIFGAFLNKGASVSQARAVRREAARHATQIRQDAAVEMGRQIAISGASGVSLEGSPLDLILQNAAQLELEAQDVVRAAAERGRVIRRRGQAQLVSGLFGVAGEAAGGVANVLRADLVSRAPSGGARLPRQRR